MRYINADELDALKEALVYEIEPAPDHRGNSGYVCPYCHSGKGKHRTGAVKLISYRGRPAWHCYKCGQWGDVFDYVRYRDGLTRGEALEYVANRYGNTGDSLRASERQASTRATATPAAGDEASRPATLKDFAGYLQTCKDSLQGSAGERYLLRRGFTRATMERAGLGFDAHRGYWNGDTQRYCFIEAVIIPYPGTGYWIARDITGKAPNKYIAPTVKEAGKRPLYGKLEGETLFVTEGELDAIAFQQAGFTAVGIGCTDGDRLIKALAALAIQGDGDAPSMNGNSPTANGDAPSMNGKAPSMIIALDNDEPGRIGATELMRQLEALDIMATVADTGRLYLGRKDAGEALAASPDEFAEAAGEALKEARGRLYGNDR